MQKQSDSTAHVIAVSPVWDTIHHPVCAMNDDLMHAVYGRRAFGVVDACSDNLLEEVVIHEHRISPREDAVVKLRLSLSDDGLLALPPASKIFAVHQTSQPTSEQAAASLEQRGLDIDRPLAAVPSQDRVKATSEIGQKVHKRLSQKKDAHRLGGLVRTVATDGR